jgi:predicted enzyme related to lactoylglutathione lyase
MPNPPLLGLRTVCYAVPDLAQARDWYAGFTGVAAYFDEPFYVGFNVGGFELGLVPSEAGAPAGPGGATAYWGVEQIDEAWPRLLALGADGIEPPQDVGGNIRVAVALDPFGNRVGIIENPNFPNRA